MNDQHSSMSSKAATSFGFVTPEDRAKWAQARAQREPHQSALKEMFKSAFSAVSEIGQESMRARLRAVHQVEAQRQRDQSQMTQRRQNGVSATSPSGGGRQTISETVDFAERDERSPLDDGFDF